MAQIRAKMDEVITGQPCSGTIRAFERFLEGLGSILRGQYWHSAASRQSEADARRGWLQFQSIFEDTHASLAPEANYATMAGRSADDKEVRKLLDAEGMPEAVRVVLCDLHASYLQLVLTVCRLHCAARQRQALHA